MDDLVETKELNAETESSSQQINGKISSRIEALKIEDAESLENRDVDLASTSMIDDHIMLEAVETFEKIQKSASKSAVKTPSRLKNMNTTMVSQEVLNMCEVFEKKVMSDKKQCDRLSKANEPKQSTETHVVRKSLNYSFGERTLKDILNESTSDLCLSSGIDDEELKKIFATQGQCVSRSRGQSTDKIEIQEFFKTLNLVNIDLNIIDDFNGLTALLATVRLNVV